MPSHTQTYSDEEDRRPSSAGIPRRPSQLTRARSEYNLSNDGNTIIDDDQNFRGARHGFDEQYSSEDVIANLADSWQMYFTDLRHETAGKPYEPRPPKEVWRMTDRLKTVSAALVVCLNLEVEPPDQLRTTPGARMEAWIDPTMPGGKALEAIGRNLQTQYENLSIRVRYKQHLDPSVEETKKFCQQLRRGAKDERVLFHYNGHGVPKPTPSGEIWVFNKNYTQYIPISLFDLQSYLAGPTLYVWDCSEAENIIPNYERFVEKHESEDAEAARIDPNHQVVNYRPFIHLAACRKGEHLPTNPKLPADLFTCCLTSPILMALHYFALQNPLHTNITPERARKLPGKLQERRTPLGELNWIFTAIADTIAWTTLPRNKFRQFFRQDLMVASLYRNFILAQRIMATYSCHPQSYPELPDTRQHELWKSWDWAIEMVLCQLDDLEAAEKGLKDYQYKSSTFFQDQLTAFSLYLDSRDAMQQRAPDQLPCVLQVLLSQHHRIRALTLLSRFLDLGPWAVNLALSIGIFPYVLKLLQSVAVEVRPVMIFIWSRILSVDNSCQQDFIKDSTCLMYFVRLLRPDEHIPVEVDVGEHKAMCAFIITMICRDYEPGQKACYPTDIMDSCVHHLKTEKTTLLRQWACLCLSQLWQTLTEAKWKATGNSQVLQEVTNLVRDPSPEVRASMMYALSTFLGIPGITDEVQKIEEGLAWTVMSIASDASPVVRKEFLVFVSTFVIRYESKFIVAAYEALVEEDTLMARSNREDVTSDIRQGLHYTPPQNRAQDGTVSPTARGLAYNTVFATMWKTLLTMSVDPHLEVQQNASIVVNVVMESVLQSRLGPSASTLLMDIERKARASTPRANPRYNHQNGSFSNNQSPTPGLLRRTASMFFDLSGALFGGEERPGQTSAAQQTNSVTQSHRASSVRNLPIESAAIAEECSDGNQQAHYNLAPEPTPGMYEPQDPQECPSLPLQSTILEWSIEHWRKPKMWNQEADEPGSIEFNERLWRKSRNESILKKTQPLKAYAGSHKWSHTLGLMSNQTQPVHLSFHQFEDYLAVADDGNTVTVWDWRNKSILSRFSNGNPIGSKIRDVRFINEDDQALLMLGSSDGSVRIYRNYDQGPNVKTVSAWRALTDMVPSNVNSGMALDWQQVKGRVLIAGDVRVIRVWDVNHELCAMDIPARSGSCVTSLTSDQMTGNHFVAGFGDGAVRTFDVRVRPQDSMVRKWRDESDRQWIMGVHMQRGGQRELLSASRNGKVRLWDLRMDRPLQTFQTTRDILRTISLHEHLPVFSVGTSTHTVKVFNLDGQELSRAEPHSSFLQQTRNISISATDFHPHRPILAASAWGDTHINLYTCESQDTDLNV